MANSTLDFSHPFFQKTIRKSKGDAAFMKALESMKALIEANHEACHRVVQPMGKKYPQCHDKIWKYDWQPATAHSSGRKSWRLVAIVPEPHVQPYRIIAGGVYPKNSVDQLTLKQLAAIFAAITSSAEEGVVRTTTSQFIRVSNGDGQLRSLCEVCGDTVAVSALDDTLLLGEDTHDCPGSPFDNSN